MNKWKLYYLFCYRNGLAEGNYKNFKKFMEGCLNEH